MTPEELRDKISNLIPHDNWELTKAPSVNCFTLWSDGRWIAVDEPAERVWFALTQPTEYEAEIDREVEELLADLRGE